MKGDGTRGGVELEGRLQLYVPSRALELAPCPRKGPRISASRLVQWYLKDGLLSYRVLVFASCSHNHDRVPTCSTWSSDLSRNVEARLLAQSL
jgi:hypothetical protein